MPSTTPDHEVTVPQTGGTAPASRAEVHRELTIFAVVQVLLTSATTTVALQQGTDVRHLGDNTPLAMTALFLSGFWPTVAALVARRVVHGRVRWSGWGLRRTTLRHLGLAWGATLLTVAASGLLLWATGLGGLDLSGGLLVPLLGLTVVVLPYVVLALGEELGWRGLVVTRLAQVSAPRTVVLVSGLAWSACHWPLIILLGGTPEGVSTTYAVVVFTVAVTAFAAVLASMQLRWGVWPVCVAHAVWNATLYQVLEPLTAERGTTDWFATETGALLAVTSVAAAVLWWRRYPLRRTAQGTTVAA